MTVQTVPFALQNAAHSAATFRQSASAPFASGGVLGPTEMLVAAQASPNMSVQILPGRAKVAGNSVASLPGLAAVTSQAMYDVFNDANVSVTLAAASSVNPRIDAIYIGVQDSYYSGSANQAIAGVVTGTAAASPGVPSIPQNSLLLAYVAVAANASAISNANITPQQVVAALQNGVISPWTPALTGSGGNPSVGNGTLNGWYALNGKQCTFQAGFGFGGTGSSGSGNVSCSLPAPASPGQYLQNVNGFIYKNVSGSTVWGPISGYIGAGASSVLLVLASGSALTGATAFGASGSYLIVSGSYLTI